VPGDGQGVSRLIAIRKYSRNTLQNVLDTVLSRGNLPKNCRDLVDTMGNPRTSSGNLTREQAMIVHKIERAAPEFLFAIFELHQIQNDLESRNLPESAELQKVADRIGSAIHEFLAVLDPANEEVQQADSNLNRSKR
jgi:hypothetical protein